MVSKKRLLLLFLGFALLLAWFLPSTATFYVDYAYRTPATVYLDGKAAFPLDTSFWYSAYTARLRPGLHTLTLRRGATTDTRTFLYLHVNSPILEYGHFQDVPGLTLDVRWWNVGEAHWE